MRRKVFPEKDVKGLPVISEHRETRKKSSGWGRPRGTEPRVGTGAGCAESKKLVGGVRIRTDRVGTGGLAFLKGCFEEWS